MFDLITEPLIRVRLHDGSRAKLSLPALYQQLANDSVDSFVALRAHQRHPWHAFLCQLGAVACLKAGLEKPPQDAATWADMLDALIPDFPDGEPWWLVAPPDKPALLQPVIGPLDALRTASTPDEIDMLVTAKNHDLKAARIIRYELDDWLFALVTLQTFEGYLGAGNFGISRMNGGFANRPGIGLAPPGGPGRHVMRDIGRMIAIETDLLDRHPEYEPDGPALLWLEPWDGSRSLPRKGLHPYYVEICRRVRLVQEGVSLTARVGNSKVARIAMTKDESGITGDPWTPIVLDGDSAKALSIEGRGFNYRRVAAILMADGISPSPLQAPGPEEEGEGWSLSCRAIARGQGKTEGYHERRVPIPRRILTRIRRGELREIGAVSSKRIEQAAVVRRALWVGLMNLFQNGPENIDPRDPSSSKRAEPFLDRFQAEVDRDFFEQLFAEAGEADGDTRLALRTAWLLDLRRRAHAFLKTAQAGSPTSTVRRHRAVVRAESALDRTFYRAKELKDYFRSTADAA